MIRAALFFVCLASPVHAGVDLAIIGDEHEYLTIDGSIEAGDAEHIFHALHDAEDVTHVVLNSRGGSLGEALRIGRLIRSFDLATVVAPGGSCLSACFFAFAGGVDRSVPDDARLGVHQFSGTNADETAESAQALAQTLTAELFAYVQEMGLDLGVMTHALRTPADTMHIFSRDELASLNIDRVAVAPAGDAPCPFPPDWEVKDPMNLYPQCR